MNCANHADASAVAYCRTCGKALCANCTRPVRGVIYCEDCLGAKMEGAAPAPPQSPYQQGMEPGLGVKVTPGPTSGPNPTVAGILAGFFPFGVGAVYTGQYAKGLAHLAISVFLFAGAVAADDRHNDALQAVCIIGLLFFYVYQIIDSVRSAKAIQMAQPIPDPFGLAATFSTGTKLETSKVPVGAVVLIFLGVIFLLNTVGFDLNLHRFWGLIPIAVGAWLFANRWGLVGAARGCRCERCRAHCLMGPAVLVTVGVIGIIDSFRNVGFFGYAGGLLLVIGAVKLFQGTASTEGHIWLPGGVAPPSGGPIPPVPPEPPLPPVPPTSEVNRG
jgi:hypothetical protein